VTTRLAAGLLLVLFVIPCVHGLRWDTPTVDEFAHLPSGYYTLTTGRFDLFPLNPPLIKVLSAVPLLALRPSLDPDARIENTGWYPWIYGTGFMERNRPIYDRIFLFGRLPVVVCRDAPGLAGLPLVAGASRLRSRSRFSVSNGFLSVADRSRPPGDRGRGAGVLLRPGAYLFHGVRPKSDPGRARALRSRSGPGSALKSSRPCCSIWSSSCSP
jgi:hypothetical protein